ncbi:MAG: hypothetical protein HXY30_05305 [Pseudorhodoplanes sp.]|nr:hypothetical protein [Pseudorhodoplanes sp.]
MDESSWFGLIELFVAFGAVTGWGVLELVCLRLDKKRRQDAERPRRAPES